VQARLGRSGRAAGCFRIFVTTANERARRKDAMRAFHFFGRDLCIHGAFVPNAHILTMFDDELMTAGRAEMRRRFR
jgi:hypothetical protein